MVIFIHGPDTFRSRRRLQLLEAAFKKKYDAEGHHVVRLDGAGLSVEAFRQAVTTAGLFSKRRLIVIEELLAKNKKSKVLEGILEALKAKAVPEEYVVIFWEGGLDLKTKSPLRAWLAKQKAEDFSLLTGAKLITWLKSEAKNQGGDLEPAAAQRLANITGGDLWRASNEISKLAAYAGQRPISVQDVDTLIVTVPASRVFDLTDALGEKRTADAVKSIQLLLNSGLHPLVLVQVIGRQIELLLKVKSIQADVPHPTALARRLGIHPFVAQKALAQSKRFTDQELKDWFERVVRLDEQLKSSRLEPGALIESFALSR